MLVLPVGATGTSTGTGIADTGDGNGNGQGRRVDSNGHPGGGGCHAPDKWTDLSSGQTCQVDWRYSCVPALRQIERDAIELIG